MKYEVARSQRRPQSAGNGLNRFWGGSGRSGAGIVNSQGQNSRWAFAMLNPAAVSCYALELGSVRQSGQRMPEMNQGVRVESCRIPADSRDVLCECPYGSPMYFREGIYRMAVQA